MDGAIVQVAPDGTIQYRASALGSCTKALVAARLGYDPLPPPKVAEDLFREGHFHEHQVLERLGEMGYPVVRMEEEVKVDVTSKIRVVGHIDGVTLGKGEDEDFLIEIKTQSPDTWKTFQRQGWDGGLFPKYKWQVSAYMLAVGLPLMLVRKNRSSGEIDTKIVDEPFYTLADIRKRVMDVEIEARTKGEVGEECDKNDGWFCPYRYLHVEVEVADVEPLREAEVEELAQGYVEAGKEAKAAQDRREGARKRLRAGLVADKNKTASGVLVTFYKAKNPPSLDKERMKEDGVDVDKYVVQTESERLKVTLPKMIKAKGGDGDAALDGNA